MTVRGEAVLWAVPDEATLGVTVSTLEKAPGTALADVARRSETLLALLDELGVGKRERSTSGVNVHEEFDHTPRGRRSLGHRAEARVAVRVTDAEVIGHILTRATAELAAHVDGPRWQISRENPVRLDAAREAAADAKRKAQAYAEGVGARLGALRRLAEPDPGFPRRALVPMRASAEASMPIEPGEQEVVAAIEATFALELT